MSPGLGKPENEEKLENLRRIRLRLAVFPNGGGLAPLWMRSLPEDPQVTTRLSSSGAMERISSTTTHRWRFFPNVGPSLLINSSPFLIVSYFITSNDHISLRKYSIAYFIDLFYLLVIAKISSPIDSCLI